MTKRGLQLGGQFRYLFGDRRPIRRRGRRRGPARRPRRPTRRATRSSWQHNQQFAAVARRLLQPQQGLRRQVLRRLRRPHRGHVAEDAAARGGLSPTCGTVERARARAAFQTLQDPNAPVVPPYNRVPQVLGTLRRDRLAGLSSRGIGEYARLRADDAGRRATAPCCIRRSRGAGRAGRGSSPRARACTCAAIRPRPTRCRRADGTPGVAVPITSLDAGLVFERDWTHVRHRLHADARAARVLRLHPVSATRTSCRCSTRRMDDFNFSQLFTENRYIGNDRIGDANQLDARASRRACSIRRPARSGCASAVGQRFYFEDQRVTLRARCRARRRRSDFLLGAEGRLTEAWARDRAACSTTSTPARPSASTSARATHPAPGQASWPRRYRYTRELVDQSAASIGAEADRPVGAVAAHARNWTLLGALELLAPGPQDAGGASRASSTMAAAGCCAWSGSG